MYLKKKTKIFNPKVLSLGMIVSEFVIWYRCGSDRRVVARYENPENPAGKKIGNVLSIPKAEHTIPGDGANQIPLL